jgi:hypothetical protein
MDNKERLYQLGIVNWDWYIKHCNEKTYRKYNADSFLFKGVIIDPIAADKEEEQFLVLVTKAIDPKSIPEEVDYPFRRYFREQLSEKEKELFDQRYIKYISFLYKEELDCPKVYYDVFGWLNGHD